MVTIEGSESLQGELRALLLEFSDVLSVTLPPEPAKLPPLELEVEEEKWEIAANTRPPRRLPIHHQEELRNQVDTLVNCRVLLPLALAALGTVVRFFSQVMFVPKPDNTWRFVCDFRNLNKATKPYIWPLPNISDLIDRIGQSKPKIFGRIDMTKGFYQLPAGISVKILTAIITVYGIYVWLRVPMGISQAPAHFQCMMETYVLAGLTHLICEVYLDDIILHATSETEFVNRTRLVLERLRQYNLVANPKKVVLGASKMLVLGHLLDEEGIQMADFRIKTITDLPLPTTIKQLRAFLGMANYFRDHIMNASILTHPLHELIDKNSQRRDHVKWNEKAKAAFKALQEAITNCPKLYYLRDTNLDLELILRTDACDYGIGGFLFQRNKRTEEIFPIMFVSKSLPAVMVRWTIQEKEAFAIVYVIRKLQLLLLGRKFLLQTDNNNLTYINSGETPKIVRWRISLQEFDFQVEHIPGKENMVADNFSRWVPNRLEETQKQQELNTLVVINNNTKSTRQPLILGALKHMVQHMTPPGNVLTEDLCLYELNQEQQIPQEKTEIIAQVHGFTAGHGGWQRTYNRLQEYLQRQNIPSWRGIIKDVRKFVQECPACQKLQELKPLINARRFSSVEVLLPMHTLNMDCITGLKPDNTFKFDTLLVIIDKFSRWVELYPLASASAAEVARALLQHFGRYGLPTRLQSDQGPEFVNDVISEFLRFLPDVSHHITLAHSKEENALVENANKRILFTLKAILFDVNILEAWVTYLPLAQRILNATVNPSHRFAPAQIIFGNAIDLNRNIFASIEQIQTRLLRKERGEAEVEPTSSSRAIVGNSHEESLTTLEVEDEIAERDELAISEHMKKMLDAQKQIISIAQECQKAFNNEHLQQNEGLDETIYPNGSYVLAQYHMTRMGKRPPNKLMTPWKGPFVVINHQGSKYWLRDLVSNKVVEYHVTSLKPFQYNPDKTDPRIVANRDQQAFDVERILAHQGEGTRKATYTFLVRWIGYTADDDTWLPWSELRNNIKLHEYLRQINKASWIPRQFRN
jgi:hypothetical protein